ncbi:hypothetical protein ACF3MZ_29290 [Paenibacillaceae bacterium WGS1546]|uniref:hypothetical protein n=1 Tax=Cohnella sp. WGS1546 TaxID=3366810 RepID=UPI00372CEC8C
MTKLTSNIGLTKPLESDFVDLGILNKNLDIIDQTIGPMDNVPTASKSAAGAISEISEKLSKKEPQKLVLSNGTQIVDGGDIPAVIHPTMQGRTLINLLGRDGNPSYGDKFGVSSQSTKAIDTSKAYIGTQSIKQVTQTAAAAAGIRVSRSYEVGKYYIFRSSVWIDTDIQSMRVRIALGPTTGAEGGDASVVLGYFDMNRKGQWQTAFAKYSGDGRTGALTYPSHAEDTHIGDTLWLGAFAIYEVSAAEYDEFDSLTENQKNARYPYVDDMKHVNAVYIENKGKNLLPPFSEWTPPSGSYEIRNPYEFYGGDTGIRISLKVVPGATYTLTAKRYGMVEIHANDTDTTVDGAQQTAIVVETAETDGDFVHTFTVPAGKSYVRIKFSYETLGFVRWISYPMLNIGSEALPFEPQQPSYLYLPDCNLRSNVDGSVADRLYTDGQGKPRVTRRFREMVLDGSLAWTYHSKISDYKRVTIANVIDSLDLGRLIKYNGQILPNIAGALTVEAYNLSTGKDIWMNLPNADTGWGESYTPTVDEIKAYFNGWKMYTNGQPYTSTYNGTGTKAWTYANNVGASSTINLPIVFAPSYTPYRLMYQLAQSVDEAVTYEGSLMLHEGDNQVEVGTGIVVREFGFTPYLSGDYYYINAINGGAFDATLLKFRTKKILNLYQDAAKMKAWYLSTALAYGEERIAIPEANYRKSSAYSVTYLALDTYTLGIAPQTISAEYAPNIRESVESLVREVVEARTETSVLRNTKAQKQQGQWINSTLLAEWTGSINYRKNETGQLEIVISATPGTITGLTTIAVLPEGYRPARTTSLKVINNNTGAMVNGELYITRNGSIVIALGSTLGTTNYQGSYVIPLQ